MKLATNFTRLLSYIDETSFFIIGANNGIHVFNINNAVTPTYVVDIESHSAQFFYHQKNLQVSFFNQSKLIFKDFSNKNSLCHHSCSSCNVGFRLDFCTGCSAGYTLQPDNSCKFSCSADNFYNEKDATCASSCPIGTFKRQKSCVGCIKNCSECTEDGKCSKCSTGYRYSVSDGCVQVYDIKEFALSTGRCGMCHPWCKSCSQSTSDKCDSCKTSSFLNFVNSTCSDTCLSNEYYHSSTDKCEKCHNSCLECSYSFENTCLKCKQGYFYRKGRCIISCPKGEKTDYAQYLCIGTSKSKSLC